jgi:UDP-glucose 4-epimerase
MTANLTGMRCAVLGASGFIGTNLCRSLSGRVDSLRAFGRRQIPPEELAGCEWIAGDFSDPTCLPNVIDGCDVVFHLINTSTPAAANVDKIAELQSNVVSTLHLLDACRETGVQRVVFISSGGTVYGIPDQVPTPETAPTNPITAYGVSKLTIEKYLKLYEHLYGLQYRVLRVANPFGPHQTAQRNQGAIAAFARRALAGKAIEIWGDGNVTRDYIYIDDVVEALELASIHAGPGRIFNVGCGEGRSLSAIVAAIERLLETDISIHYRPGRPVDVPVNILDCGYAMRELGWRPRTQFIDGLSNTVAWMRNWLHDSRPHAG